MLQRTRELHDWLKRSKASFPLRVDASESLLDSVGMVSVSCITFFSVSLKTWMTSGGKKTKYPSTVFLHIAGTLLQVLSSSYQKVSGSDTASHLPGRTNWQLQFSFRKCKT
jgi:hypothetical protein